ncbi:MAG: transporter, partial [Pseudomonadota bacterium]
VAPAMAQALDFSLVGSLGEGGFSRYVPPVTNPVFNETPLITTEIRPIYIHQNIPDDFLTGGGNVDIVAAQIRVAVTDRFGLLATTDGFADVDFDNNALPDSDGFADLAIGAKYALHYDPAAGEVFTLGARYTLPSGDITVGALELSGNGAGYIHAFASAMKIAGPWQFQGSLGIEQGLSSELTSFFHASAHISYELFDGFYPLVEANVFLPYDGGDQIPGSSLTGFEVADLGSSDPEDTVTVAGGFRWRLHDNAIMGAAFEYNLNESANSLFEWRSMFDVAIHF